MNIAKQLFQYNEMDDDKDDRDEVKVSGTEVRRKISFDVKSKVKAPCKEATAIDDPSMWRAETHSNPI
jgi:hypothetical protein